MSDIVLLDTSVYLNVLDVPGWNQDRKDVLAEFALRVKAQDHFLLPLATVWETGNHIAELASGNRRRHYAQKLADDVKKAIEGYVPYRPTYFPSPQDFVAWLQDFPDFAQRSKSPKRSHLGISLTDMSIIKEWERACRLHRMSSVLIWSLDDDLKGYHQVP